MPKVLFLDTGYVIALINIKDQYHSAAVALADRYENFPVITTSAILLEIGNALTRNYKSEAQQILHHLLTDENTTIIHRGLVDCFSFITMEKYQIHQALTFDRHFTQAGFEVLQPA
jgi:predicted nucleic acid-binding protein